MSTAHTFPARAVRTSQRGVTLIEVLVALVIMAVGLLGISGLYVETLRANRTAQLRTQAVNLVNDMSDRIRANRRGRATYVKAATTTLTGTPRDCGALACKTDELAKYDLVNWVDAVAQRLPGNAGAPPKTSVGYQAVGLMDRYTVRIEWQEPATVDALSYQLVFDVVPPT